VILLGFLWPLAAYLLVLGLINRRSYPLMVSGVWDFVGLLVGVSGFLTLGGPLILDRLNDQLRLGWLARPGSGSETINPAQLGLILHLLYFLVIVLGVTFLLARQRHLTSLYNIDPEQLEEALEETFSRLGLHPLRSGRTFFFRATVVRETPREEPVSTATGITPERRLDAPQESASPAPLDTPAAVLEIDPFVSFRHVTLRWDPVRGAVREEVEAELARTLAESPTEPGEVSFWLILAGLFLLGLGLIAAVAWLVVWLT
jgi:hypothetical protein